VALGIDSSARKTRPLRPSAQPPQARVSCFPVGSLRRPKDSYCNAGYLSLPVSHRRGPGGAAPRRAVAHRVEVTHFWPLPSLHMEQCQQHCNSAWWQSLLFLHNLALNRDENRNRQVPGETEPPLSMSCFMGHQEHSMEQEGHWNRRTATVSHEVVFCYYFLNFSLCT
jgi:hypothetical protein